MIELLVRTKNNKINFKSKKKNFKIFFVQNTVRGNPAWGGDQAS